MSSRPWDVILFGATGFTGSLTAEYLAENAPPGLRVALAGRSRAKLEALKAKLGERGVRFGLVVADVLNLESLAAMAAASRVVISTVGPYARYGLPLVEACAARAAHYCDITGEVQFMRRSMDACDKAARASGVRIVHGCGFDSIPSDLGMLAIHELARARGLSGQFKHATLAVQRIKGGFSGGTVASMINAVQEATADRSVRRLFADPYALSPNRAQEPDLGPQKDQRDLRYDAFVGQWTAPFVMEGVNARVVRRTNALAGYPYGRELRYRETTALFGAKGFFSGAAITAAMGLIVGSQQYPLTRTLTKAFLPKPGEGPDKATRAAGLFELRLEAETIEGSRLFARIAGASDPGYGETAKMLAEAAMCLVLNNAELSDAAGVLTPATAMGTALTERLRAAGMTFEASPGGTSYAREA